VNTILPCGKLFKYFYVSCLRLLISLLVLSIITCVKRDYLPALLVILRCVLNSIFSRFSILILTCSAIPISSRHAQQESIRRTTAIWFQGSGAILTEDELLRGIPDRGLLSRCIERFSISRYSAQSVCGSLLYSGFVYICSEGLSHFQ